MAYSKKKESTTASITTNNHYLSGRKNSHTHTSYTDKSRTFILMSDSDDTDSDISQFSIDIENTEQVRINTIEKDRRKSIDREQSYNINTEEREITPPPVYIQTNININLTDGDIKPKEKIEQKHNTINFGLNSNLLKDNQLVGNKQNNDLSIKSNHSGKKHKNRIKMDDPLSKQQKQFVQTLDTLLNDPKIKIGWWPFKRLPTGAKAIKSKFSELTKKKLITQLDYAELCNTILVNAYDDPLDALNRQHISSDYSKHKSILRTKKTVELYSSIIEKLNASCSNDNNKISHNNSHSISKELSTSNKLSKKSEQKTLNPTLYNFMKVGTFRQLSKNIGDDFTKKDFQDILYQGLKP